MKIRILFSLSFFSLCCCIGKKDVKHVANTNRDSLDFVIEDFIKDSLGCKGLRTKKTIEFIYLKTEMKGKTKEELIRLIGLQDDSTSANGLLNLRYYFNRSCSNGVPVDSVDNCWANFNIDLTSRTVLDLEFECE